MSLLVLLWLGSMFSSCGLGGRSSSSLQTTTGCDARVRDGLPPTRTDFQQKKKKKKGNTTQFAGKHCHLLDSLKRFLEEGGLAALLLRCGCCCIILFLVGNEIFFFF